MPPKWAKKTHFVDISDNVSVQRTLSYFRLETLHFTIFRQMYPLKEKTQQILTITAYFHTIYKEKTSLWEYKCH